MRSAAKIALAFLLGLMLAGTHGAPLSAGQSSSASADCVCSGCSRPCCATREAPTPQPAAPVRASVPSTLFLAVLVRSLAVLPESRQTVSTAISSAPLTATSVPLYQRDCTYLI